MLPQTPYSVLQSSPLYSLGYIGQKITLPLNIFQFFAPDCPNILFVHPPKTEVRDHDLHSGGGGVPLSPAEGWCCYGHCSYLDCEDQEHLTKYPV